MQICAGKMTVCAALVSEISKVLFLRGDVGLGLGLSSTNGAPAPPICLYFSGGWGDSFTEVKKEARI